LARILVIEDYPPLAKVIAIGLGRRGHQVERAGSARRALEIEGPLDCVVLDVDLPDGNGVDVAEDLLRLDRTRLVVFFSATRDSDARQRALHLGPFVDKTESVESLFDLIDDELRDREALAKAVGAPDGTLPKATARSGTRRKVR
jgi:DNA-binding response OmpR family regulator